MSPHVLVVSTKVDVATDAVVEVLVSRGARCSRINTEDFPFDSSLTVGIDAGEVASSYALADNRAAPLRDVTAVWYRRVRIPQKPERMNPGVYDFCLRESRAALLGSVLGSARRVMSPPDAVWGAEHKLLQLRLAREVGLAIPATVVTNDPDEIRRAFQRFNGRMIAKPVKTGFVDYGDEQHAVYTNQVLAEHLDGVETARLSPAIFQPLIEKKCDVRVTIVGDQLFTAEIDSQTDAAATIDWRRTSNPLLPHRRGELARDVERRVLELVKRLGLTFAAVDFVRTPDGEDVFLEVNPNGQWLWLDDMLGFGITEAVADWLRGEP